MNERSAVLGMRSKLPISMVTIGLLILVALLGEQLWVSYRNQIAAAEVTTLNLAAIFDNTSWAFTDEE